MRYSAILCIAWLGIHAACALTPTVSVANTTQVCEPTSSRYARQRSVCCPLKQPILQADVCALVKQQPAADQCRFIREHCVSGWMFERFVTDLLRLRIAESSE